MTDHNLDNKTTDPQHDGSTHFYAENFGRTVGAPAAQDGIAEIAPGKITKEDVDFIKSMCFQGPDMTERQERRMHRIIDELRLIANARAERKEEDINTANEFALGTHHERDLF